MLQDFERSTKEALPSMYQTPAEQDGCAGWEKHRIRVSPELIAGDELGGS